MSRLRVARNARLYPKSVKPKTRARLGSAESETNDPTTAPHVTKTRTAAVRIQQVLCSRHKATRDHRHFLHCFSNAWRLFGNRQISTHHRQRSRFRSIPDSGDLPVPGRLWDVGVRARGGTVASFSVSREPATLPCLCRTRVHVHFKVRSLQVGMKQCSFRGVRVGVIG